jgi:copper chaperone CopZ
MAKQSFSVPSMHCSSCVMLLEGLEDEVAGVSRVEASYQKQRMEVEYDEGRVTVEQIIAAARKEGYEATPV